MLTSRAALIVPILVMLARGCSAAPPIQLASAQALRDSLGVNTHLEYDETPYADSVRVAAALRLTGLSHVRDAALRSGPERTARFTEAAAGGARFDLFFSAELDAQLARVDGLEQTHRGAIELLEGPNEANHEAFYGGRPGDAAAVRAYQDDLYKRAHADPLVGGLPVAAFTYWPPLSGRADLANFHSYPSPRRALAPQLGWMRAMSQAVQPKAVPVVCTETGFPTGGSDAISEARQAELTPVLVLENFRAHVMRTYLYELFDEHPSSWIAPSDREDHWGLFTFDGRAKPAALAVGRFMRLLQTSGVRAKRRMPWARVQGDGLRWLRIEREDGVRLTFLWWGDAQRVRSRTLKIEDPGRGASLQDIATGAAGPLASGQSRVALGASASVIVQPAPG